MEGAESKGLLQLIAEASECEPQESEKLRKGEPFERAVSGGTVNTTLKSTGRLTKEAKCELAVIAVKRAFSQCPNLSLLVSAFLFYTWMAVFESFCGP